MKRKYILFGCIIIALITGIFISKYRQPKYNMVKAAAITAINSTKTTKPRVKKEKPCSCCEMRLERMKKMIQRARVRRNAQM